MAPTNAMMITMKASMLLLHHRMPARLKAHSSLNRSLRTRRRCRFLRDWKTARKYTCTKGVILRQI